jgi:hypothetical protein
MDGALYINSSVTNPDGIKPGETIELEYVMLGNIPLSDPTYKLEAFTYDDDGIKNTPAYEWAMASPFVLVTPDPRSYANSRATLSLPANKQQGTTSLRIDDMGNSVFRTIPVKVSGILLPAPIAYYPFNGSAEDETGNGYNGQAFGGATITTDRFDKPSSSYLFNGKDGYIAINNLHYGNDSSAFASTNSELTVCAWIKTTVPDYGERIIDFGYQNYWTLINNSDGKITWYIVEKNSTPYAITSSKSYGDSSWHFVCATYDSTSQKMNLYIDGSLEASDEVGGIGIGNGVTSYGFIGAMSLDATTFNSGLGVTSAINMWTGQIDDVMLFDQALTPVQIEALSKQ